MFNVIFLFHFYFEILQDRRGSELEDRKNDEPVLLLFTSNFSSRLM